MSAQPTQNRHTAIFAVPDLIQRLELFYIDARPSGEPKATILLIHGWPQTSHQYRHVLPLLTAQGYRCIVPDYRGAGDSSKPSNTTPSNFLKTVMAADLIALLDHLGIVEPIHLVGHDIGGKIAFALASRYPERFRSVCWGENSLPGSGMYRRDRTVPARTVQQFHFIFHCVSDLAEELIKGREKIYVSHFFNKIAYNHSAFSDADVDYYAKAYAQPGVIRCFLNMYTAFEEDAKENEAWIREKGKCGVPTLILSGEQSYMMEEAEEMARDVTEEECLEVGVVKGAAHYVAEENPEEFVRVVTDFIEKH